MVLAARLARLTTPVLFRGRVWFGKGAALSGLRFFFFRAANRTLQDWPELENLG